METKLSRFCDRIIEAGWLAALIAIPVFFNIYSSRVFEPDKLTLLRSLVLVMIAAWIALRVETWRTAQEKPRTADETQPNLWQRLRGMPLVLPTLLMVVAYIISTVFSVVPGLSWSGSYVRLQGTSTTFSYIVIFFLMLDRLQTRGQLDRVLQTTILASVPPSLYGILQHYGLDPLPWAGPVTERVSSTMGNPIFIAAYLLMAFFVTLYKTLQVFGRLSRSKETSMWDALLGGVYLFIMAVQLIAIFFSQSRGPWLGLLGGLYAFVLIALIALRQTAQSGKGSALRDLMRGVGFGAGTLVVGGALAWLGIHNMGSPLVGLLLLGAAVVVPYAALVASRKGLRWLWSSWVTQTLLVAGFLVVFNLPSTPLESLRETPYIGRLGQVFQTDTGTGKVRVLIWEGAAKMVVANPLRTLIGYGPESMYVAYEPYYPPDLAHYEARNRTPDRSHNQTFDALISTGVLGFLAYMFLFTSIFYYGLKWLGLIRSPRDRGLFLGFIIGGAALGVLLAWAVTGGFAFLGVSLPAGFIVGLLVYLVVAAVNPRGPAESALTGERRMLVTALMAAMLGHFIEIHFGFVVASTGTYFWAMAALFVLVGLGRIGEEHVPAVHRREEHSRKGKRKKRQYVQVQGAPASQGPGRWGALWSYTFIVGMILSVVAFDFTSNQLRQASILSILRDALTKINAISGDPRLSYGLIMLIVLTVLTGAVVAFYQALHSENRPANSGWYLRAALAFLAAIVLIPLAVAWVKADALRVGQQVGDVISRWYIAFFLLVLVLAAALPRYGASPAKLWRKETAWSYLLIFAAAGFLTWNANGILVQADILYQQGFVLEQDLTNKGSSLSDEQKVSALGQVLDFYKRAIADAPTEDFYYLATARVYQQTAQLVQDPTQREAVLTEGIATVEKARSLYPLNVDHTSNMARLYRTWAETSTDPEQKREKLELASQYYADAVKLSPNKAQLYNEWGLTYYLMGDDDEALQKLQKSLSLDSQFDQTYLLIGQVYTNEQNWPQAEAAYRKAVELSPKSVESLSMLGYILDQEGNVTESIQVNLSVLELAPQDYLTIRNLAVLYNKAGEPSQALAYAELALSMAPEADKAQLQDFVSRLEALVGPQQ